jgi:hypothetical protein
MALGIRVLRRFSAVAVATWVDDTGPSYFPIHTGQSPLQVIFLFLEKRRNSLSAFVELQLVEEPVAATILPARLSHAPLVPADFRVPLAEILAAPGIPPDFSELFSRPVDPLSTPA